MKTRPAEKLSIKIIRHMIKRWPLPRGKGLLLSAFGPLLKGRIVFEASPGVTVQGPLSDFTFLWHFTCPFHEERPLAFALSIIRAGDVVLDIGANFGLWSLGLARIVGSEGKVIAFEPVPVNVESIRENLSLNGLSNVRIVAACASDVDGSATFSLPPSGNSAVGRLAVTTASGDTLTAPAVTLDRFCEREGIDRVSLLKIDVEGAEILVLRGARRLLASDDAPILIFELDPVMPGDFSSSPEEVLRLVQENGYSTYLFAGGGLESISLPLFKQVDVIALKPSHLAARPCGKWFIGEA